MTTRTSVAQAVTPAGSIDTNFAFSTIYFPDSFGESECAVEDVIINLLLKNVLICWKKIVFNNFERPEKIYGWQQVKQK